MSSNNDDDKEWVPISEDALHNLFGSSNEEIDKTNWDALDYKQIRDASYYAKYFPGFSEENTSDISSM